MQNNFFQSKRIWLLSLMFFKVTSITVAHEKNVKISATSSMTADSGEVLPSLRQEAAEFSSSYFTFSRQDIEQAAQVFLQAHNNKQSLYPEHNQLGTLHTDKQASRRAGTHTDISEKIDTYANIHQALDLHGEEAPYGRITITQMEKIKEVDDEEDAE